ncbi:hypothetical protein R6Q57_026021 [Mikania cordata]
MIHQFTIPLKGPSLRFLNDKRRSPFISTGKVCVRGQMSLLHAIEAHLTFKSRSSLYEVLRVKRDATSNEIKAAYRNLAKIYHPDSSDLQQHDDSKFIEIHDAYATLYDPADRAMYDMKLSMGLGRRSGFYTNTSRRWETDQCW